MYTGNENGQSLINMAIYWAKEYTPLVLSILVSLLLLIGRRENRKLGLFCTMFIIVSVCLISISGFNYGHYAIILLPCVIVPLCVFYDYIISNISILKGKTVIINYVILIIISACFIGEQLRIINLIIPDEVLVKPYRDMSWQNVTVDYVKNNTKKDDTILAWGNNSKMYLLMDRFASSKYFYQEPILDVNEEMKNEFLETFDENRPKMIILMQEHEKKYEEKNLLISEKLDKYYKRVKLDGEYYILYELKN